MDWDLSRENPQSHISMDSKKFKADAVKGKKLKVLPRVWNEHHFGAGIHHDQKLSRRVGNPGNLMT